MEDSTAEFAELREAAQEKKAAYFRDMTKAENDYNGHWNTIRLLDITEDEWNERNRLVRIFNEKRDIFFTYGNTLRQADSDFTEALAGANGDEEAVRAAVAAYRAAVE